MCHCRNVARMQKKGDFARNVERMFYTDRAKRPAELSIPMKLQEFAPTRGMCVALLHTLYNVIAESATMQKAIALKYYDT